jgi:hypothetical protein
MNVLDLDVYMDVLYIMCAIYMFCNSSCANYTVFQKNFYSLGLSTMAGKAVVDKESNLLWPTQP